MSRFLVAGATALILAACATLSPEQCQNADWRQIGYADGAQGLPGSRIQDHASACAKHGVRPDMEAYLSGRMEGLISYCQAENGFEVGRSGRPDNAGDCPPHLRPAFLDQYQQGKEINSLQGQVNNLRSALENERSQTRRDDERLENIRRELRKPNVSASQREAMLNEMERIMDRRQDSGRRQLAMQRDLDIAQQRLDARLRQMRR
jgi:hypothetical protein